ncbi:unnamed protein product [Ilex paraguariensis]|uniref:Uncharacterized protein n=1 Tax=Ilex paraguariensis TaxID=185542 RepID=A0ABC8SWJ1_9AQUA
MGLDDIMINVDVQVLLGVLGSVPLVSLVVLLRPFGCGHWLELGASMLSVCCYVVVCYGASALMWFRGHAGLGGVIDVVEVHVLLGVLGSFKRLSRFSISLDAVCDVLLGCWFWLGVALFCFDWNGVVLFCYATGLLFLLCVVLCTVYMTVHVNSLPADVNGFSTTLLSCWLLATASLLDFSFISWFLVLSAGPACCLCWTVTAMFIYGARISPANELELLRYCFGE